MNYVLTILNYIWATWPLNEITIFLGHIVIYSIYHHNNFDQIGPMLIK